MIKLIRRSARSCVFCWDDKINHGLNRKKKLYVADHRQITIGCPSDYVVGCYRNQFRIGRTLATPPPLPPAVLGEIGNFSDCRRFPDPLLDPNLGYPGNLEDIYPSGMVITHRKSPKITTRRPGKPVFDLSGEFLSFVILVVLASFLIHPPWDLDLP